MRKLNKSIFLSLLVLLGIGVLQILSLLLFNKNLFRYLLFGDYLIEGIAYLHKITGAVFFILFPMLFVTFFLLVITVLEALKILQINSHIREHVISAAYYIEILAPVLGFLQTLWSNFKLLPEIQADLEQAELLSMFVRRAGEAFGSSVFGLSIMALAFSIGFIHKLRKKGDKHEESSHIPGRDSSFTINLSGDFLPDVPEYFKGKEQRSE